MKQPVYFVRHGQSEWNLARRTQGQTAHPALTALGRAQASAAAELIATDLSDDAARLLSSDLVRARETASVIAARVGLPVCEDVRLREQQLGALEGKGYDETWAAADAHDWSDPSLAVAGGESVLDVATRMGALLDGLDRSMVTVLVSHGDAIRLALGHLVGHEPHRAPWVAVPNGAVARVDADRTITWLDRAGD